MVPRLQLFDFVVVSRSPTTPLALLLPLIMIISKRHFSKSAAEMFTELQEEQLSEKTIKSCQHCAKGHIDKQKKDKYYIWRNANFS